MNPEFGKDSRILVVGTSGSGKSTLARRLAGSLGIRDIELDALFWKANWVQSDPEEFRARVVAEIGAGPGYVIQGNYSKIMDLTWGRADTVIWLDYPRYLVMWRVLARTIRRIMVREVLWAGNVESFGNTVFAKDSIVRWAWNTYRTRKEQYSALFRDNPYGVGRLLRFRRPREARSFLEGLDTPKGPGRP